MKDNEKPSYKAASEQPPPTATSTTNPSSTAEQPPPYSRNDPDAINFITTTAGAQILSNPYYTNPTPTSAPGEAVWVPKSEAAAPAPEPEPERVYRQIGYKELPHWLRRNLQAAVATVWLIWLPVFVLVTFAILMKDDLEDDIVDWTCANKYIDKANEPWDRNDWYQDQTGRYHSQCIQLLRWSQALIAAVSVSMFRSTLQIIPIRDPVPLKEEQGFTLNRLFSPAKVYGLRTVFSLAATVLYMTCAVLLGTSRFLTGPKVDTIDGPEYLVMYQVCLGFIVLNLLLSLHQTLATAAASWYLRGPSSQKRGIF